MFFLPSISGATLRERGQQMLIHLLTEARKNMSICDGVEKEKNPAHVSIISYIVSGECIDHPTNVSFIAQTSIFFLSLFSPSLLRSRFRQSVEHIAQ